MRCGQRTLGGAGRTRRLSRRVPRRGQRRGLASAPAFNTALASTLSEASRVFGAGLCPLGDWGVDPQPDLFAIVAVSVVSAFVMIDSLRVFERIVT